MTQHSKFAVAALALRHGFDTIRKIMDRVRGVETAVMPEVIAVSTAVAPVALPYETAVALGIGALASALDTTDDIIDGKPVVISIDSFVANAVRTNVLPQLLTAVKTLKL